MEALRAIMLAQVADDRQWFKAAQGLETSETPRDVFFRGHAILGEETFAVGDAHKDPRFSDNPLVTRFPKIKAHAGHPLHGANGSRVGTLCVFDTCARKFIVVLSDCRLETAKIVCERIRSFVADEQIAIHGELIDVTFSIGLAVSAPEFDSTTPVVASADAAMHRAREQGGNIVVIEAAGDMKDVRHSSPWTGVS
jgi:hypothetical protein